MHTNKFPGNEGLNVGKRFFKLLKYLAGPEYMDLLLVTYDLPNVLETVSKFLQEISRRLSLFALHNYLHEVVMPGVPDFNNLKKQHVSG